MSTRNSLLAGASRFAHLKIGRGHRAEDDDRRDDDEQPKGKKSKRADDDDPEKGDTGDPDSGGMKKSKRAEDDDDGEDDDDEPKGKKSKRADDGTDDGYGDDDDDEDEPKSKGKKSGRAADDDEDCDDDDEREMNGRSAAASARRRERARCAAILGHPAAAANVPLAVSLATETTMGRDAAIKLLKGEERRARERGAERPDRASRNPSVGVDARGTGRSAVQAGWDAAIAKVLPKAVRDRKAR